jgi:hypothetical protein
MMALDCSFFMHVCPKSMPGPWQWKTLQTLAAWTQVIRRVNSMAVVTMEEARSSKPRLNKSESVTAWSAALQKQEVKLMYRVNDSQAPTMVKGWVSLPCSDFLIWETVLEKEVHAT